MYNDKSDIVRVKAENVASMIKPGQYDGILAAPDSESNALTGKKRASRSCLQETKSNLKRLCQTSRLLEVKHD